MIVTEGPKLDENLKKVTPWWDVVSKYLIAAMMAIALTSIVVQVSKDSMICVPAIDCSTTPKVSDDAAKLCKSLMPKCLKKKVLTKMIDRRLYDYVDSACFHEELSWFTKFFPLILLGEAVLLLVWDMMWTTLPCSSSVLNDFVALADEIYSNLETIDIILGRVQGRVQQEEQQGAVSDSSEKRTKIFEKISCCNTSDDEEKSNNSGRQIELEDRTHDNNLRSTPFIPKEDHALKVQDLAKKAEKFKGKYTSNEGCCMKCSCFSISLSCFYNIRIFLQCLTSSTSFVVNCCFFYK